MPWTDSSATYRRSAGRDSAHALPLRRRHGTRKEARGRIQTRRNIRIHVERNGRHFSGCRRRYHCRHQRYNDLGSYCYHIVRLSCALFRPLILDKSIVNVDAIITLCKNELGVVMHRPTASFLTGAVEQAEPIVMFQIELAEPNYNTIETIRWMT